MQSETESKYIYIIIFKRKSKNVMWKNENTTMVEKERGKYGLIVWKMRMKRVNLDIWYS